MLLLVVGGVLLTAAVVASLGSVTAEQTGCGSVIAPVHNSNARIDRVCDMARSDRSTAAWVLGVGGLVTVGVGVALRLNGSGRH